MNLNGNSIYVKCATQKIPILNQFGDILVYNFLDPLKRLQIEALIQEIEAYSARNNDAYQPLINNNLKTLG